MRRRLYYLLPDLPKGNYDIWVRGYGLIDSPKVKSTPGKTLDLKAVAAPNRAAAAQYYPAIYWYSMVNVPAANLGPFPPVLVASFGQDFGIGNVAVVFVCLKIS